MALAVGDTETLSATVDPENADNKAITFESSDPAVATVTPKQGKVTAVAVGTATVKVTTEDGGYTAECEVTIS